MNPLSILVSVLFVAILALFWFRKWSIVQGLVIGNFAVFVATILTGDLVSIRGSPLLQDLALVPRDLADPNPVRFYTLFTSTFLHADMPHVVGNMLVLIMIGLPFEERVGRTRFLLIYFGSAIVGVALHAIYAAGTDPVAGLDTPMVGASGAVFGILGAFAATYPRDQIPMVLIVIFLRKVPVIVAAIVLTFVEAVFLVAGQGLGGVARAAHIGGAIGGIAFGLLLKPRRDATAGGGPSRIDYETLDRLALEPKQRDLVERLRMNEGHPELQAAWLERLPTTFRCPLCGRPYTQPRHGLLRCTNGHEERYAR